MKRSRHRGRPLVVAITVVLVTAMAPSGMAGAVGPATAGGIDTFAGSPGSGPATDVAQGVRGLAVRDGVVYSADSANVVVRALDLSTGQQNVAFGHDQAEPVELSPQGHPASDMPLRAHDVVFDGAGNLYLSAGHQVLRVDTEGVVQRYAGNGQCRRLRDDCFSGDGGPATEAQLKNPMGLVFDAAGNLYIADAGNNRIRKVDTGGTITTVAGTGQGFNYTTGESPFDGQTTAPGDGAPAHLAVLNHPGDVTLDAAGNLYIADTFHHRIRRVDAATGIITTVAGSGPVGYGHQQPFSGDGGPATEATLDGPSGLLVAPNGDLYFTDTCNNRVRAIAAATQVIDTVAGRGPQGCPPPVPSPGGGPAFGDGGPAPEAYLANPSALAFDPAGNLLIADTGNHRLRTVDTDGPISTTAGTGFPHLGGDGGPATTAQLHRPEGAAVGADGAVYVADTFNHRIRRIAADGTVSTVAGTGPTGNTSGGIDGDGGPALHAELNMPADVAVGPDGSLYIADRRNHRVRRLSTDGLLTTVAGSGETGNRGGGLAGDGGPATEALLQEPSGVAVADDGSLYIADTGNNRVRKVDGDGVITSVAGGGATAGGFDGDGGPAIEAVLWEPSSVAVADDGSLYIADTRNHRVRRVGPDGIITTVAGSGGGDGVVFAGDGGPAIQARLALPRDVVVDDAGALFVADQFNERVRKVDTTGVITTVAGTGPGGSRGAGGYAGDGGLAISAKLDAPSGLALGADGILYIAERDNDRVRAVAGAAQAHEVTVLGSGSGVITDPAEVRVRVLYRGVRPKVTATITLVDEVGQRVYTDAPVTNGDPVEVTVDADGLRDGIVTVTATFGPPGSNAGDGGRHGTTTTRTLLDRVVPTATIDDPAPLYTHRAVTAASDLTFTGSAADALSGVEDVTVRLVELDWEARMDYHRDGTWSAGFGSHPQMASGTYTVTAQSFDRAGNPSAVQTVRIMVVSGTG